MSTAQARLGLGTRYVAVLAVLALLASAAAALAIGAVDVPVPRVMSVILRRLDFGDYQVTQLEDQLVWQLRMPRVLGAAAVGAILAGCGAVLQSLTRNDLADPYLLGISGGATVGAVSVIVLGAGVAGLAGNAALSVAAFLGALGALAIVLLVAAGRGGSLAPARTVLAGVAVAQICAAYTSLVVIMAGDGDAARRVLSWTLGSMAGLRWDTSAALLAMALLTTLLFTACAGPLDAFAFGETSARSLGVRVDRIRWMLMVGTALATASTVAFAGAIGFVGLVVPHLVRLAVGPRHRALLPLTAVTGAVLLVWTDTLARSLVDGGEVPIGAVTALIGVPVFVWMLRRKAVGA